MELTLRIPDELAARLGADAAALERRVLEALLAGEFRAGRLGKPDLRHLLGLETSDQIDGFLKAHGIPHDYARDDLARECAALKAAIDHGLADLAAGQVRDFDAARILERGLQRRAGGTPSA